MIDSFGRRIDYLRLSVTDRCNLRCVYCRPAGAAPSTFPRNPLSNDELISLVECLAGMGIRRVRITGGEPLVRPGIPEIISRIASISGIEDVSLTTNGTLLAGMARRLAQAGLRRVNVSLDTLKPERFLKITHLDGLDQVLAGIDEALSSGLHPVKLNVVVMRGTNEDEIPDFIRLTRQMPVHVRFIELMPIGETGFFNRERWVPITEIKQICGRLESVPGHERPEGSGPAVYFRSREALGTVGFIGPLTDKFCRRCNRLRLTSSGELLSCLAQRGEGPDLRSLVRSGADLGEVRTAIRKVIEEKAECHQMHPAAHSPNDRALGPRSPGGAKGVRGTWGAGGADPESSHAPRASMCSVGG